MRAIKSDIFKTSLTMIIGSSLALPSLAEYVDGFHLEEIIITARKRPQKLHEIPLSVAPVDGKLIANAAITEISGLGEFVPNLQTATSPFNNIVTIRGLGSGAANRAFEQSVAMFIDGTYAGRSNQFLSPFFDIERIEVVRGPQGVLFGKNAIAGAVNLVSAKPTSEFKGSIKSSYEFEHDGHAVEAIVSGPFSNNVKGRVAAKTGREGAYLANTTTGKEDGQVDSYVIRGLLEWDATDDLKFALKLEQSHREQDGNTFQISKTPNMGNIATLFGLVGGDTAERLDDKRSANTSEFIDIDTDNISMNIEYETDIGTLTLISSYSSYDYKQLVDTDFSSLDFSAVPAEEDFEQYSQEIRLASPLGGAVEYIVGANFLEQEIDLMHGFDLNLPLLSPMLLAIDPGSALPPFGVSPRWQYDQETSSWSVFGEVTWNIREDLRIAFGMRYTEEEKDAALTSSVSVLGAPTVDDPAARAVLAGSALGWTPAPLLEQERDEESLDPSLKIQWYPNSQIQLYTSLSKATKAGGFDSQSTSGILDDFSFEEEEVKSIEIGSRMQLAKGAAQLNMALFHTEFSDLQVSSFDGASFTIGNAAEATIEGVEVDGRWRLTKGLTVGGALAYLDAEYDDFPGFACITTPIGAPNSCDLASNNGKGGQLVFAPEWSGNIWAEYTQTVFNDWQLQSRLGANYSDDISMAQDVDPIDIQDAYWKVNARIGLITTDDIWSMALSVKNLTDKRTNTFSGDMPVFNGMHFASTAVGRQIFLELKREF